VLLVVLRRALLPAPLEQLLLSLLLLLLSLGPLQGALWAGLRSSAAALAAGPQQLLAASH
jgi:hypothetical protein